MSDKGRFISNTADEGQQGQVRVVNPPGGLEAARQKADSMLNLRYVAFSDQAGVFLGVNKYGDEGKAGIWSRIDPKGVSTAPTYTSKDEFDRLLQSEGMSVTFPCRMVQVKADLDLNHASKDSISKALLPTW
jgi:hypothetical protein